MTLSEPLCLIPIYMARTTYELEEKFAEFVKKCKGLEIVDCTFNSHRIIYDGVIYFLYSANTSTCTLYYILIPRC